MNDYFSQTPEPTLHGTLYIFAATSAIDTPQQIPHTQQTLPVTSLVELS